MAFVVVVILCVILYVGYILCRKSRIARWCVITFILFVIFNVYEAIFPFDDFYKCQFVDVTELPFPESGKIVKKYASYPDIHGDYMACAFIQVSEEDYKSLQEILLKKLGQSDKDFSGVCVDDEAWEKLNSDFELLTAKENAHNEVREWGLLKGKRMVYIGFHSW